MECAFKNFTALNNGYPQVFFKKLLKLIAILKFHQRLF